METKDPPAVPGATPPAWDALVREHLGYLRNRVLSERIPEADREDVLQEVLHSISRALPTFDPARGELRAWLKAIVHNHASNYRRRASRRREQPWPDEPLEIADAAPSSEERRMEAERRQLLSTLLLDLPPERRQAVIAHELDEAGIGHVAALLSIPATTAKSRVRHGLADLKAAARRWQARRQRRLAVLLAIHGAGPEKRASRAASWRLLLQPVRRGLRRAVSGARTPRARAVAHAFASLAASAWSVLLTAGLLMAGHGLRHGGIHPGGAATQDASSTAGAHASSTVEPAAHAGELSYSPADDKTPSSGEKGASNGGDTVPARHRHTSRSPRRWPGAQGDEQEHRRMAAAARAIGDDALAHALLAGAITTSAASLPRLTATWPPLPPRP
ncbi:sigma-70 family RNA polymerase sigma factor [Sorangium sp. So ce117]|uniref:sigma-70 family RNA polymerase sigma factor n=1 Tax=Sorangium sp. So ce117 TaxID=3133277 RepID=UPI003F5D9004